MIWEDEEVGRKVGDVVLVKDKQRNRASRGPGKGFRIDTREGRILQNCKMKSGSDNSATQRLYSSDIDVECADVPADKFRKTRSDRVMKPARRLDLKSNLVVLFAV